MDAFFASVEQRDHPRLKGIPVAVGGSAERGVVAAASYEARAFGVHSAMPSKTAKRLCPNLVFVKPRFEVYKYVSQQIRKIFLGHTALVEPLSLDEAYLDVSQNIRGLPTATEIARIIKQEIYAKTQLTASAGVSYNKFLAKMASDVNKPNGIFVIKPQKAQAFIDQLDVKQFYGIGKVTARKMYQMGIQTGFHLRQKEAGFLSQHFGKAGLYYYQIAQGKDDRPVNPERIRKSIGCENTFTKDHTEQEDLYRELNQIQEELWKRMQNSKAYGKTLSLKIKFSDFEIITRSKSSQYLLMEESLLSKVAYELLNQEMPFRKSVRLMGLSVSNLIFEDEMKGRQLTLAF